MVKFTAQHINISRPMVERVGRGVNADEGVSGLDPIQKTLLVGNRQISRCAGENHAVVIFQIVRRQFLQRNFQGVFPCVLGGFEGRLVRVGRVLFQVRRFLRRLLDKINGELAAGLRQLRQDFFKRRNRTVPEAACRGDNEQFFWCGLQRGCQQRGDQERGDFFHFYFLVLIVQGSSGN